MTNYQPGDKVQLRLWGGQVVDAQIIRTGLIFNLVTFGTSSEYRNAYIKASWRPKWRMWK